MVETNDVEYAVLGPYWAGGLPVQHFQGHVTLGYQVGSVPHLHFGFLSDDRQSHR